MGKNKIEKAGFSAFFRVMVIDHQKIGGQGHDFPGQHESDNICGGHNQCHGTNENAEEKIMNSRFCSRLFMLHIMKTVYGCQKGNGKNSNKKKSGKPVNLKGEGKHIQKLKRCGLANGLQKLCYSIGQPP